MKSKTREIFKLFNVDINPDAMVQDLSPAKQQIVEIAKAVSKNVKILIMDEPSAPLSVSEVEHMFEIIRHLKQSGVTVIYISHRLEEVFRISDRVTVMRDGRYVATKLTKDTNRKELISLMVGRELKESYPSRSNPPGEIALEVKNLSGNGDKDISFSVRKGEILGISGLVGAGRTELAMLLFGAVPIEGGEIWVEGKPVQIRSPQDAIQQGIGLLTEDRKGQGLFLEMGVGWNISFPIIRRLSKYGVVNTKTENEIAEKYKQRMNIKTPSLMQRVINLSGGNQQKVVLAKSLAAESDILIFDEPTRGIDVGAKQEIYNLMCELANNGIAILMISSDMEELAGDVGQDHCALRGQAGRRSQARAIQPGLHSRPGIGYTLILWEIFDEKSGRTLSGNLSGRISYGMRAYAPLMILIGLVILFTFISPNFMTSYNIRILIRQVSFDSHQRGRGSCL